MKTSNQFLIAALVVLLSSLAAYNIVLKAEYKSESYKDPYRNYVAMDFSDFEEVEVNPGTKLNVLIEQGETHAVYLYKENEEVIKLSQDGKRLKVDLALTDEHDKVRGWQSPMVIIRTPNLSLLRTNAVHTSNGKVETTLKRSSMQYYHLVDVKGLKQERLTLDLDNGSNVRLVGNELTTLQAVAGNSQESNPMLLITTDNKIQQAELDIRNNAYLVLQNVAIPDVRCTFSETAQVELSGASLAILRK